jgi:hypothetical protein
MSDAEKKVEEVKKTEEVKAPEMQVFAESRGKYSVMKEAKVFSFEFPSTCKLGENYDVLSFLKNKVWEGMENQRKIEEEKQKPQEKQPEKKEEKN